MNITKMLEKSGISFCRDLAVSGRSSFKVGGTVAVAVFPQSREELVTALSLLDECGIRCEILGNASNTLFGFDYFDGAMIFTSGISDLSVSDKRIYVDCGVSLGAIARAALGQGLTGFEFAYGIPGLVGGSVYMNSGAYGSQMSSVVEYSDAYDRESGEIIRIYDHHFGYRKSIYEENKNLVCLGACFLLEPGSEEDIRARMNENMSSRREKQPLEYPSAGSYFKRPEGNFAGKLIEDAGLKGLCVGGACVSEKHAGFIINRGGATWQDVLILEEKIREAVAERFDVVLEREVRVVR